MKFEKANVLITGGASGIGKIMGRMALEKGASCLIIWDINPHNISSAVNELSQLGKVKGYIVDVSGNELVTEAVEDAVATAVSSFFSNLWEETKSFFRNLVSGF